MRVRVATIVVACAALALPGCGSSGSAQVPRADANQLITLLREAKREASTNPPECNALSATIRQLQARVSGLPANLDSNVRDSLTNGVNRLSDFASQQCAQTQTTNTNTTPTTPTTNTNTTPTTQTQTTPSTPTTNTTTTPTTPTTPTTTPTTPTTNGGTTSPGNGPGQQGAAGGGQ